jgi:type I restriction enzyme S subunit
VTDIHPLRFVASNPTSKAEASDILALDQVESWTGRIEAVDSEVASLSEGVAFRWGDVLFSKLRPYLAKSVRPEHDGIASTEFVVLRPDSARLDSRFLHYSTLMPGFVEWATATSYGTKMPRSNWEALGRYELWVPSLEVQRRVADMLDVETARIDTLITKNQTVLRSLAQRIVSLRAELLWPTEARRAWTGSPLDAPTSAVPSATKVQYVVPIRVAGGTPATGIDAYWSEDLDDLPWFGVGDFAHGHATGEPSRRVTDSGVVAAGLKVMQQGDLLLAMYGATSGKAGFLSEPGTTNQAVMAMRSNPRVLRQDYLIEWFNFARPYAYEKAESRSSTQPNLNAGQIEQFSIRCPSLPEQDAATKTLAHAREPADALRQRVERQIGLLQTRRRALIMAAVTGQITV